MSLNHRKATILNPLKIRNRTIRAKRMLTKRMKPKKTVTKVKKPNLETKLRDRINQKTRRVIPMNQMKVLMQKRILTNKNHLKKAKANSLTSLKTQIVNRLKKTKMRIRRVRLKNLKPRKKVRKKDKAKRKAKAKRKVKLKRKVKVRKPKNLKKSSTSA